MDNLPVLTVLQVALTDGDRYHVVGSPEGDGWFPHNVMDRAFIVRPVRKFGTDWFYTSTKEWVLNPDHVMFVVVEGDHPIHSAEDGLEKAKEKAVF